MTASPRPGTARQDTIAANHQRNEDITRAARTALDTIADYLVATPESTLAPWLIDHGTHRACDLHRLGRDTAPAVARRARRLLVLASGWPTHGDDDPRITTEVDQVSDWPRRAQIALLRYAARRH